MTVDSVREAPATRLDRTTTLIVVALAAAALMAVLDGTAVAASLTTLGTTFDANVDTVVWVTVGYLISAGLAQPLAGWAADRYGGRTVFLIGLAGFVAGSILAGFAWSIGALIAFRVLQGFGGGLLEPSALALTARNAPAPLVGRVMGTLSMIINVAPILGPLFGSALDADPWWRLIFLINVPLGLIVFLATVRLLPRDRPAESSRGPIDLVGLILLPVGFVALLFALNRASAGTPAWISILLAVVGVLLLAGYVRHARTTTRTPVLDLRLLRHRGFVGSLIVMAMVGFTMFSLVIGLPLYAEQLHGLHGIARGLFVCALGVGLIVSMSNGGRISDRTGPRVLARAGAAVTAVGLTAFAVINSFAPVPVLLGLMIVIGLSFGLVAAPSFASVYRVVPAESTAQATASLFIVVQLAASTGVTVVGVITGLGPIGYSLIFALLAASQLIALVATRLLPGRPTG
ncbi:DHA2 family efflux MFS transporter permease subunit [Microlunatus parietis]|uniref:EmrB/QacA subfamily drug resistance transporter n=1 Tax=Microlunatus parietis TaxID=682979 RepID=A0A7Y9I704_9ACTN|nr:DHA2 family efflux MFS transporter permease subunit [Microlunatus parietis]NYE71307.1 EmrB/QacA subfamily drug resistance transporter [Microlunatus parietis]